MTKAHAHAHHATHAAPHRAEETPPAPAPAPVEAAALVPPAFQVVDAPRQAPVTQAVVECQRIDTTGPSVQVHLIATLPPGMSALQFQGGGRYLAEFRPAP